MQLPKILVIGHARHGKDTVCDILKKTYGFQHVSSSMFVAEKYVRRYLSSKHGITYDSLATCYEDRVNHRSKWFEAIVEYNKKDPARMAKEMLKTYDMYCGMRADREFQACRKAGLFDATIWVDALSRLPPEGEDSFNIKRQDYMHVVHNNSDLADLETNVDAVIRPILRRTSQSQRRLGGL